jgi:hypothetical protein
MAFLVCVFTLKDVGWEEKEKKGILIDISERYSTFSAPYSFCLFIFLLLHNKF